MNDDIQFLKDLQQELKTQETDIQASPRFWSIMNYKWEVTDEGYHDRVSIYFYDSAESMTLEEYAKDILEERYGDFSEDSIDELKDLIEYGSEDEVLTWIHNEDTSECHLVYETEVSFIAPNTMFVTKEDAKRHLKSNYYHYSSKAHTYAMTAWRSPNVSKLWKILEEFNWDKVNLKEEIN